MSRPKRHHTLPQRYQVGFSTDGTRTIWVFERRQQRVRRAQPPNTAVEREYYTWDSPRGAKATSLESFLATSIEGPFWPVLDRLDAQQMPDSSDRLRLAFFCAFLLSRVPAFRASVAHTFASAIAVYPHLARDAAHLDGLFERSPQGLLLAAAPKDQALQKLLDIGVKVGQFLLTLDTHFMSSYPEERFITTDNPFTLVRMVDEGQRAAVMARGFLKWIPLSARTAVAFGEPGDNISWTYVAPAKARRTNRALAAAATQLVIAGTEAHLAELVRGLPREPPPPTAFPTEII